MKVIMISLSLLLLGGCASMEQTLTPEVRYGQLYALQGALTIASHDCSDREAAFTASYWASTTAANIDEHSQFLETGSAEQLKSRELVKRLYALSYLAYHDAASCKQFALAGDTTRELLSLLTMHDS